MAGGVGRRLWPLSSRDEPKQFLKFFGEDSLLQMTSARLNGLVPPEGRFVVTNERYRAATADQLPDLPAANILSEPVSRNTAPCIAFGATRIADLDPDGVMLVLPADHLIQNVPEFHKAIRIAVEAARTRGVLVTMGIKPTHAATGFGYIEFDEPGQESGRTLFDVVSFTEKPDPTTAEAFVASGRYLWNSGMFAWRLDTILEEFQRSLPDVYEAFQHLAGGTWDDVEAITTAFTTSPNISIDYGVMEHARRVKVVPCDIGWNDVGDWQAAYDLSEKDAEGNAVSGEVRLIDSTGCYAYATNRRIVLLGTTDLVVVEAGNTILVCDRAKSQRVKEAANKADLQPSAPDQVSHR